MENKKTIQEALAEVQRAVNEKRVKDLEENWMAFSEAAKKAGMEILKKAASQASKTGKITVTDAPISGRAARRAVEPKTVATKPQGTTPPAGTTPAPAAVPVAAAPSAAPAAATPAYAVSSSPKVYAGKSALPLGANFTPRAAAPSSPRYPQISTSQAQFGKSALPPGANFTPRGSVPPVQPAAPTAGSARKGLMARATPAVVGTAAVGAAGTAAYQAGRDNAATGTGANTSTANTAAANTTTANTAAANTTKPTTANTAAAKAEPTFGQAFSAARKTATEKGSPSTGQFEYKGKQFQTNIAGEKYVPGSKQTKIDSKKEPAPSAVALPKAPETNSTSAAKMAPSSFKAEPPKPAEPEENKRKTTKSAVGGNLGFGISGGTNEEKETKMSPMIEASLRLQAVKAGNIFEAAKKLSPKEKELAALGHPKDKITHKDVLIGRGVLSKEETLPPRTAVERVKDKLGLGPKSTFDSNSKQEPYSKEDRAEMDKKVKEVQKEEVDYLFSEAELAYFESVAPTPDDYSGSHNGPSKRDLTDETVLEGRKPTGNPRGVAAGSKRGSYKRKGETEGEKEEGAAETKSVAAQIRDAHSPKMDDKSFGGSGYIELKHPATDATHKIKTSHVDKFNRDYSSAEKASDKNAVERAFIDKHMGGGAAAKQTHRAVELEPDTIDKSTASTGMNRAKVTLPKLQSMGGSTNLAKLKAYSSKKEG